MKCTVCQMKLRIVVDGERTAVYHDRQDKNQPIIGIHIKDGRIPDDVCLILHKGMEGDEK